MLEVLSGLVISGIGVIHDLVKTYGELRTWEEKDVTVDGEWLPVAVDKGILPGPISDYTWSSEEKIPTRELKGTHQVVVAVNAEKKIRYRIRQGQSMVLTKRV